MPTQSHQPLTFIHSLALSNRLKRWTQDKALSFVPPDGRFVLADYRYTSNPTSPAARFIAPTSPSALPSLSVSNLVKDTVPIPFALKSAIELGDRESKSAQIYVSSISYAYICPSLGTFNVTLTSRLTTRPIEHLVAEMHLGEGAGGIKCVASRGGGADRFGRGMDSNAVGASWAFDSNKKVNAQNFNFHSIN